MPNPVHQNPGRQRVGGAGDPVSQGLTATGRGQSRLPDRSIPSTRRPQKSRRHLRSRRPGITAGEHLHGRRRSGLFTGRQSPFEGRFGLRERLEASAENLAGRLVGRSRSLGLQVAALTFLGGLPIGNFSRGGQWGEQRRFEAMSPAHSHMKRAKDGQHRVVIALGNGVKFVVVASGTRDGHSEEGRSGGSDNVIQFVELGLELVIRLVVMDTQSQKSGGDHRVFPGVSRSTGCSHQTRCPFITGDLFSNEAVVGLVLIEGPDDVIAVAPGLPFFTIPLIAIALSKSNNIQPMTPPPLPIARTC